MAEFAYKAKDARGKMKTGKVSAASKSQARSQLVKMRLKPVMIKATKLDAPTDRGEAKGLAKYLYKDEKGRWQLSLGEAKPSAKDLIVFTKQFATMLTSGVPLIQALGILAEQQRVRSFGRIVERVRFAVENGATLSDALEAYPDIFDTLYVSMVRAGEASGNLDTILMKLVVYIEKAAKIKAQVKSAMMYPSIVVIVAIVVVSGLLLFVVPTFAEQYKDQGKELPELTNFVIGTSDFLATNWYIIFGAMFVAFVGVKMYIKTEPGRAWFDKWILMAPGIGELLRKIAVGRFCNTMATMLTSGVNLLEALTICAASSGNKTIENFVINVRSRVEQGSKFSDPLGDGDLFPRMVVSMVAVGETTGALDDMLSKVSEFYEDEVDLAVKGLLSMIEPIMIVGIGGIVGFIVIAMYLPVFDMGNLVG
jgi:type IV pilus assembly protein PilC